MKYSAYLSSLGTAFIKSFNLEDPKLRARMDTFVTTTVNRRLHSRRRLVKEIKELGATDDFLVKKQEELIEELIIKEVAWNAIAVMLEARLQVLEETLGSDFPLAVKGKSCRAVSIH